MTAIERWRRLTSRRQWAIADRVAQRRGQELRKRIAGLVSLGPGYRTRGKGERTEDVVLRFLVVKKWRGRKPAPGAVPHLVRAFIAKAGKRSMVAIPTDVFSAPRMRPHAALASPEGVRVRWAGSNAAVTGAACCLVVEANNPGVLYLLGCHHVLTGSLRNPGCGPRPGCVAYLGSTGQRIGAVVDWCELVPNSGYGLDVALAAGEDPAAAARAVGSAQPQKVSTGAQPPAAYSIVTPRGVLGANLLSYQYNLELPYQCGATVRIRRAIESAAATMPGDSGSPLIWFDTATGETTLVGMHFYGSYTGTSLALDARTLFDPGLFGKVLRLP